MVTNNMEFEKSEFNFKNKIIFLDVDGSLIPDGGLEFNPEVINKVEKLKEKNSVFLCTNSRDRIRNSKIEAILALPIITNRYKKPNHKIIDGLGVGGAQNKFLVIGDKVLIDGLFAKNIGARFIRVKRKISGRESILIRTINFIDDLIWRMLHPRNPI